MGQLYFRYLTLFFGVLCSISNGMAQDERYYRAIFSGDLRPVQQEKVTKSYKWQVSTPSYQVDLDGDGLMESIKVLKKDGEDWFEIENSNGKNLLAYQLENLGVSSYLYKIHQTELSAKENILILYFYQGYAKATQFQGSARAYFVVYDKKDLKQIFAYQGPSYFDEREKVRDQYWRRHYHVDVIDFNGDGIKEVSVNMNKLARVLFYKGNGVWAPL